MNTEKKISDFDILKHLSNQDDKSLKCCVLPNNLIRSDYKINKGSTMTIEIDSETFQGFLDGSYVGVCYFLPRDKYKDAKEKLKNK